LFAPEFGGQKSRAIAVLAHLTWRAADQKQFLHVLFSIFLLDIAAQKTDNHYDDKHD
jgi:hypothetical protein